MEIEIGQKVTDRITGFTGVVTGKVNYISGCEQALVAPRVDKDGKLVSSEWFDVQRLDAVADHATVVVDNARTLGFDTPAPRR
jgi:hypothetical protein